MKSTNITRKVVRPASITPDMGRSLKEQAAAAAAAKRQYEQGKQNFFDTLVKELQENPGMTVICKDVAAISGLYPTQVGSELSSRYSEGVRHEPVVVTRTYAEVDEAGRLIEGGEVKTIRKEYSGYRFKDANDRGW